VVLREVDATAAFGDKRVVVAEFAAELIYLAPRTVRDPYHRYAVVVEFGAELFKSWQKVSAGGDERVDCILDQCRRVAQRVTPNLIVAEHVYINLLDQKKNAGRIPARLACPGDPPGMFSFNPSYRKWKWTLPANSPWEC